MLTLAKLLGLVVPTLLAGAFLGWVVKTADPSSWPPPEDDR